MTGTQPPLAVFTTNEPARVRSRPALRMAVPALRLALATIFVWFGVLKLIGHSPVAGLLADTFPWFEPRTVLVVLGTFEVALGLGLVLRRSARIALPVVAAHLAGTFVTFLIAPGRMFQHGNPFLLSGEGEFVVKNLVYVAVVVVLLERETARSAPDSKVWSRRCPRAGTRAGLALTASRPRANRDGPGRTSPAPTSSPPEPTASNGAPIGRPTRS